MNENDRHEAFEATVQGELYREVVDIYAEPENFPREEASPFAERVLQLIDKAVDARDAEIREALLSAEAVEAMARKMFQQEDVLSQQTGAHGEGPWAMYVYRDMVKEQLAAALTAIGLAEEGAER